MAPPAEPAGVDAEIRTTILEKSGGQGVRAGSEKASDALARQLFWRAPKSPYRPYLLEDVIAWYEKNVKPKRK